MPEMLEPDLYATPRRVSDPSACFFYHTIDVPGRGRMEGVWDLRGREQAYLGGVDLRGRRVLEIGTANGALCFWMERQGAEVVAYDLDERQDWDIVPFARPSEIESLADRRDMIRRINDGYWLCHEAFGSRAKVVHGSVYAVPEAIGPVDVTTVCSVLLHLRDPFRALENALRLSTRAVVITERIVAKRLPIYLLSALGARYAGFEPRWRTGKPYETWWVLTPRLLREWIGILGFERSRTTWHFQKCGGQKRLVFTIVGERTAPPPAERTRSPR